MTLWLRSLPAGHKNTGTWTDTLLYLPSSDPVPAPLEQGSPKEGDTALALKELPIVGKVWPACLQGELKTSSLPAAVGRAWPGS